MKYLVITMRGAQFDPAVIPAHYRFLGELREQGVLEQAGQFTDESGGAYVLSVKDQGEAQRIAKLDPLGLVSCSAITVHEWEAS